MRIMPDISNARRKQPTWIRDLLFAVLALLFLIGLTWLSGWGASRHARDVERLFAAWRGDGLAGPMWCIVLQALQVVFFFVPGEILSFAAGYIFGTWHGLAYSFAGIMMGSAFNFYLARVVGRPALARQHEPEAAVLEDPVDKARGPQERHQDEPVDDERRAREVLEPGGDEVERQEDQDGERHRPGDRDERIRLYRRPR